MQANTILKSLRGGAIALALIAATALPQTTSAGSIQSRGDFGGTWTRIGPSDHWRHERHYYAAPVYVAPPYAYDLDYGESDDARPLITIMAPALPLAGPESASPSASIRLRH